MKMFEIYKEFSSRLSEFGDCYLAGGCVRDYLRNKEAKDYDFFILNHNLWENFEESKQKILAKLIDLPISKSLVEWHKSEPYLVVSCEYDGVEIQILLNPAKTVDELLDTFDWNTCLFAYGKGGITQKEFIQNIGPGKELKLNKVTFPLSTLRRGFRFSERFLMKIRREDINLLCGKILENSVKNNDIGPNGNEPDMSSLNKNILVN
jgi:hypothetical protein